MVEWGQYCNKYILGVRKLTRVSNVSFHVVQLIRRRKFLPCFLKPVSFLHLLKVYSLTNNHHCKISRKWSRILTSSYSSTRILSHYWIFIGYHQRACFCECSNKKTDTFVVLDNKKLFFLSSSWLLTFFVIETYCPECNNQKLKTSKGMLYFNFIFIGYFFGWCNIAY